MIFVLPVDGLLGTRSVASGVLASVMLERTEVMPWDKEDREKYNVPYADRPEEQKVAARAARKAKAVEIALAEGREPGRVGAPPRLSDEEREVSRIRQNKKRTARTIAKRTARRAAKAIAVGRVPGQAGQPRVLTDEERAANRKTSHKIWRAANLLDRRRIEAERARAKTAARAEAEGRVPGTLGHLATFSAEELAAYLERWPREKDIYHGRVQTQNSRAKKMGIPGKITAMDIREIYVEQAGLCAFCAKPFGDEIPEIDHWIAMNNGGPNTHDNIRLLHKVCNRTKGGKPLEAFGLLPLHEMMLEFPPDDIVSPQED